MAWINLWVLAVGVCSVAHAEPVTRVTEAPREDTDAWHEPGFRLDLRLGYEVLRSWETVPVGNGLLLGIGSGWQFTEAWSLDVNMTYMVFVDSPGGLTGLRWAVTAGPTWHPWAGLGLGAAASYANMLTNWQSDPDEFSPSAGFCDGPTARGLIHADYMFALTEWFAMGPTAQAGVAVVKCQDIDTTGVPQSVPVWPQYDFMVSWVLGFR